MINSQTTPKGPSPNCSIQYQMPVRTVDLFCGAGGSSWGARNAGARILAGFDLWNPAISAYKANFPEAAVFREPLEDLDPGAIAKHLGRIDLMLASPECTNHGPARGSRQRSERSRDTALQVPRFAKHFKPRWILIENVTAMKKWHRFAELKDRIRSLDYQISEYALDASHFGVPQSRRRLFLVCDRKQKPSLDLNSHARSRVAADAVDLNGAFTWSPVFSPRRAKATLERFNRGVQAVGMAKPFLLVYYGSDFAGGWQRLDRPLRTITTLDRFAIVRPSRSGHLMRMLQVPELKKAMGMPKRFQTVSHTRREQIHLLGNAVCPPVVQHIVRRLSH